MRYYPEFPLAIPHLKANSYVFLTRPPLDIATPLDLHVLGIPPAFNLSQDQTLQLIFKSETRDDWLESSSLLSFDLAMSHFDTLCVAGFASTESIHSNHLSLTFKELC